jgi:hypothetical protein
MRCSVNLTDNANVSVGTPACIFKVVDRDSRFLRNFIICLENHTVQIPRHVSSVHRMLYKGSSFGVSWCSHSQNCIRSGQSSGNRCALYEHWCGPNWSGTLGSDSPNSRVISGQILNGSPSTAAIMASSLAGIGTVHGRPAFTCVISCLMEMQLNRRNTSASRRRAHARAAEPPLLLQVPWVKSKLRYSSRAYYMIIGPQLAPSMHYVLWVTNNTPESLRTCVV